MENGVIERLAEDVEEANGSVEWLALGRRVCRGTALGRRLDTVCTAEEEASERALGAERIGGAGIFEGVGLEDVTFAV